MERKVFIPMKKLAKQCTLEVKVQVTGTQIFDFKVKIVKFFLWLCVKVGGFKGYKVQFTDGSLEKEESRIIIPDRRIL